MRMCLLYARCSISYSMYIHILLCLGGCRTLCVTMYVASPLNLLRRLPFSLNTLCQNKSGISFEPSCSYGKELKEIILLNIQNVLRSLYVWAILDAKRFWLCNVIVRDFLHGMKLTPYETTRMSWNLRTVQCKKSRIWRNSYCWDLPNAYTLVSRWLPNTLCYNACGISF